MFQESVELSFAGLNAMMICSEPDNRIQKRIILQCELDDTMVDEMSTPGAQEEMSICQGFLIEREVELQIIG